MAGALATALACTAAAPASPTNAAAAADDLAVALRRLLAQDRLLLAVGERLMTGARRHCPARGWSAGMIVQQLDQYDARYRPAAMAVLNVGDRPTVVAVAEGGAAAAAGLRPGDQIAQADGHAFAALPPIRAAGGYAGVAAAMAVLDDALADGSAALGIVRDGQSWRTMLTARSACRVRFEVRPGRSANASADGVTVQLGSGLIADTRGEGEVAAVVAHELAHNVLRHPQRLKAREPGLSVRATEIAADRLSVYLLDEAGFAPADAIRFWSRWGRARDQGVFSGRSHPRWRERVALIEAEAGAIDRARAAGSPVEPPADLRPPSVAGSSPPAMIKAS